MWVNRVEWLDHGVWWEETGVRFRPRSVEKKKPAAADFVKLVFFQELGQVVHEGGQVAFLVDVDGDLDVRVRVV